jgi:hypothetical protein
LIPASLVGDGLACVGGAPPTVGAEDTGALFGAALVVAVLLFVLFELPASCNEEQPPERAATARSAETAKIRRMILSFSLLVCRKSQSARPTLR